MYHALIIEDNLFYQELITDVIDLNGYNALVCEDTRSIAGLIKEHAASLRLIMLDLQLNDQDGIQVLRAIAQADFNGRVALISDAEDSILSSATHYISELDLTPLPPIKKPFDHSAIQPLLEQYLSTDGVNDALHPKKATSFIDTDIEITEQTLEESLDRGDLVNFYQPITSLGGDHLRSLECLARIPCQDGKYLYPEQYLHLLENNPSLSQKHLLLVLFNLQKDFFQLQSMQEGIHIALNLTGQDISDIDLPDSIEQHLGDLPIENNQLTFEIKHAHTVDCLKTALDVLIRLRLKGFSICIDDFGSGTQELKQLRHLPFSELKIDKVLIDRAASDKKAQTIIQNIIHMAHGLGLTVTAECVENAQTARILKGMKCDQAQGHFYALPDTAGNIADYLHHLNEHKETTTEEDDLKELSVEPLTSKESQAHQNVLKLIEAHLDQQTISHPHKHNIALCAPLSGKLAALGKSYYLGANLAFFTQRERSTSIKNNLNFTVYNSHSSTQKMIDLMATPEMDGIDSWIGSICPIADSKQLIHAFSEHKKILFAPYNGSHEFHETEHHNIFNFKNSYYEELKRIVQHCDRTGGRKCLLMNHSAMGISLKKIIEKEFPEVDVLLVHSTEEDDIARLIEHLKKIQPAHIMFASSLRLFINVVLHYRDHHPNCHFYTVSLIPISAIKKSLPNNIENIYFTSAVPSLHQDLKVVREFWNAVELAKLKDAKRFVNAIALEAFIAMRFSLLILEEANFPTTPELLNNYLEKHPIADLGLKAPLHWNPPQREFGPTTKLMVLSGGEWLEID